MKSACCFEDILGIRIETYDETRSHPKTLALDGANAIQRITPQILKFLASARDSLEGLSIPTKT
jgi:hypothetical protein